MSSPEPAAHFLDAEEELRVEVALGSSVVLTLVDGTAEIFGAELPKGAPVTLPGGKHAVFTWHGATLEMVGEPEICYSAKETPMVAYSNVEGIMEARRKEAAESSGRVSGPRIALVGPTDVGKSSLAKILLNYAVRKGWAPTFADLDLGQGGITCPATVGATPVDRPVDVAEGVPLEMPLVFFHGDASPGNNPELYKYLVTRVGQMLDRRLDANPACDHAGVVVNTQGWVDGVGYKLLLHALDALKITDVFVIGQERLHAQLHNDTRGKVAGGGDSGESKRVPRSVQVWKLPKSGGVVERDAAFRRKCRDRKIREYFYGPGGDSLAPSSNTLPFGAVSIFKIGGGPKAPASALPIGQVSSNDPLRVTTVAPSMALLNSVLAVSHGKTQAELLSSNVAGFVYVTEVDVANGRFTYTSPCSGELPSRNLIAGSLKWIEANA
jgi:polyribonucleotide 5'-hydroxyl-kinase